MSSKCRAAIHRREKRQLQKREPWFSADGTFNMPKFERALRAMPDDEVLALRDAIADHLKQEDSSHRK